MKNKIIILLILLQTTLLWSANPIVTMEIKWGHRDSNDLWGDVSPTTNDLVIELYPDKAPITVDNFLHYLNNDDYNWTAFHRMIRYSPPYSYMGIAQTGGFYYYPESQQYGPFPETAPPIINESYNGLSNLKGTIAMARTSDSNSATSGFYINQVDNLFLDKENASDGYGYCVFGNVIKGLDIIDSILTAQTYSNGEPIYYVFAIAEPRLINHDLSSKSDLARDGVINFEDFAVIAQNWTLTDCNSSNSFCNGSDINFDGNVDIEDLVIFSQNWQVTVGTELRASDLNYDSVMDYVDLQILFDNWLRTSCNADNNFCNGADIDNDGIVNFSDYQRLAQNWLKTIP